MSEDTNVGPGYSSVQQVSGNVNQALIAQIVQAAVDKALADKAEADRLANLPKIKTPEEAAREVLDLMGKHPSGIGKGYAERIDELHAVVSLIASKVGI